jgi:hypothetical protein
MFMSCALLKPAYCETESTALLVQQTPVQGGTITPDAGVHHFDLHTDVTLTAVPRPGYQFVYWLGDVSDPTAKRTVVCLDAPKIVIAIFERAKFEFMDVQERAQSAPGGGLFISAADFGRQAFSGGGGRRSNGPRLSGDVPEDDDDFPVPVPEPATVCLLGLGGLSLLRRRHRKHIFKRKTKMKKIITICALVTLMTALGSIARADNPVSWDFSLETFGEDVATSPTNNINVDVGYPRYDYTWVLTTSKVWVSGTAWRDIDMPDSGSSHVDGGVPFVDELILHIDSPGIVADFLLTVDSGGFGMISLENITLGTHPYGEATRAWLEGNITVTAVPEPATICLLGIGGLSLLCRRRKGHILRGKLK